MSRSARSASVLTAPCCSCPSSAASAKKKKALHSRRATSSPRRERRPAISRRRCSNAPSSCTTARTTTRRRSSSTRSIEGESGDSEPNKQKAEFWMGKALYNMKFYSASLSYFDRIVQKGPSHAYYNATLKWLASLSRQLPDSTGILEKIGKYNRAELDQPALEKVRDELYFLLGKFYYQKGNFKEAVELFQAVPPNSEFYVQAKLFEGATHVREYQAKPAVESFKEVLAGRGRERRPRSQAVRGHRQPVAGAHVLLDRPVRPGGEVLRPRLAGRRTTGRTACSSRRGRTSCSSRRATRRRSATSTPSRRRSSTSYIKPESVAEALTVKATIYFYNCLYDRAEEAIDEFNAIYPDVFQELKKLITGTTDNGDAVRGRGQDPQADLGPARAGRARRARRSRRPDAWSSASSTCDELDRELKRYDKADAVLEVDQHRPERLRRPDPAAVAGGERGRRSGPPPHQAPHRASSSQLIKRVIKIEYEILARREGRAGGRGRAGAAGHQPDRRHSAPTRSASTTSTSSGRSPASTGATSSGTTGSRSPTSAAKSAPEGAPATGETPAPPRAAARRAAAPAGGGAPPAAPYVGD